jgi:hypothetical protein
MRRTYGAIASDVIPGNTSGGEGISLLKDEMAYHIKACLSMLLYVYISTFIKVIHAPTHMNDQTCKIN